MGNSKSKETVEKDLKNEGNQEINFYTGYPYSEEYYKLLEKRKDLPVTKYKNEFMKLLSENQCVVVVGETGSGKTTQIPQWCVEYSRSVGDKTVACTQPRRVPAMSIAKRVSEEMDVKLGQQVGYAIRFENCSGPSTILKYVTDGILLRETMSAPDLNQYQVIVLDEVHERGLNTDILMGVLKDLFKRRSDIKLVVMSATLDDEKFQKYFDNAPSMFVEGRTHPVEIFFKPKSVHYFDAAIASVMQIHKFEKTPGDILVFLTGQNEIEAACETIELEMEKLGEEFGDYVCLPLYSCLPLDIQRRIFDPAPPNKANGAISRKIIFSTNIAETSLTIDGVVFVIDSGVSKKKIHIPQDNSDILCVTPISKSSAKQRTGRAGRTKPGKCFRMYTEQYFNSVMPNNDQPEILNYNIASIVLQLKKIGIKDVMELKLMDFPKPAQIKNAVKFLKTLDALDDNEDLTEVGNLMAEFPLEPTLSKSLVKSCFYNCTKEMLTIAAMLSIPPCFIRPTKEKELADKAKMKFADPKGDHFMLINVYKQFKLNSKDCEGELAEEWCKENYLHYQHLKFSIDIRKQLKSIMSQNYLIDVTNTRHLPGTQEYYTNIGKALLEGFFVQVAHRQSRKWITTNKQEAIIHPSSCVSKQNERVLFNESIKTSMNFLFTVTAIESKWLREISPRRQNATSEDVFENLTSLVKFQLNNMKI